MNQPAIAARAGRREWIGLAVLSLPALLAAMDLSVLFMAVPWVAADLTPTATQQLWIMDIYGFIMAGLLITMGTLGDRIGRRRLLMYGAVAFGAASLLAAYSTTAELLILARALLGVGAATLAPSTLALIRNMFHHDGQRRVAVAIWTGAFSAGFPLGAIIGGVLVDHFFWGSVFLINLPVMALLLVVGPRLLPEYREPRPGRFDLPGAVLSVTAVLAIIYGLKKLAEGGWAPMPAAIGVAGVAVGYLFLRRQRRHSAPLIDVRLFRYPAFSASIGANTMLVLASAGAGLLAVQYLQLVLEYRPLVAALWMLPLVGLLLVGVGVGTALVRWWRPGLVVGAGLGLAATGFGLLATLQTGSGLTDLLLGYGVLQFGMGMAFTLAINLVIATAPAERAGAAAAMNETGSEFGGALGIATLGTIAAAVYRQQFTAAAPAQLPPEATAASQETLGGAMAVADHLPEALADPLRQAAQSAFVDGFAATALVGAPLLAVTAVLVTALLWRVRIDAVDEAAGR